MATNLATIIEDHPSDAPAIISRGRVTTYGELRDQVGRLRGGLRSLGLRPGDRVAIACANNWYFVVSYLAALGAGLVAVPLNPQSPAPELTRGLNTVGARAIVVGPSSRRTFSEVDRSALADLDHVIVCGASERDDLIQLDSLLSAQPVPIEERSRADLAVLLFTSGSAGRPRAAMLTHGNLLASLGQAETRHAHAARAGDVVFGLLPLHHVFGLNVALGGALHGGSALLLIERFDPSSAVADIATHGVTVVAGPPQMWAAFVELDDDRLDGAFSSVRLAVSGAAELSPALARRVAERLGVDLRQGYGLTETSPTVTSSVGVEPRPGSIGRVAPGVDVRLVGADGEDVFIGDPGEIWVRGANVFEGYWQDPEATDAAFSPDGWFRTGDIAVVDDDGYLYIVGRSKDLVIVSGFNVYPAEVEEVLRSHPGVAAAAVVGVPHPHTGEAVKAYVVGSGSEPLEEDDVIDFCRSRLARYKCPTKIDFVDQLPTERGVGKVLRRRLREPDPALAASADGARLP
ncbi:MAG: AMP-binding protein [Actinomycetota bacterium]|nr:AMP-binding protein [Actinomycetota bacterium]